MVSLVMVLLNFPVAPSTANDREKVVGSCEHVNETLGFIKCREFLGYLGNFVRGNTLLLRVGYLLS
jgi:hypothetical protein